MMSSLRMDDTCVRGAHAVLITAHARATLAGMAVGAIPNGAVGSGAGISTGPRRAC